MFLFCFEQQFFSHVEKGLPGLNQYYISFNDTTLHVSKIATLRSPVTLYQLSHRALQNKEMFLLDK